MMTDGTERIQHVQTVKETAEQKNVLEQERLDKIRPKWESWRPRTPKAGLRNPYRSKDKWKRLDRQGRIKNWEIWLRCVWSRFKDWGKTREESIDDCYDQVGYRCDEDGVFLGTDEMEQRGMGFL
jgi:hypothetical protein